MTAPIETRLQFLEVPASHPSASFSQAVAEGLSGPHKWLPCRFFYDSIGSRLFERICQLPEYYLTRTEQAILEQYAPEMLEAAGQDLTLVELGSGSSCKTRLLLNAGLARQRSLRYIPIDISSEFLRLSALTLLGEYDRLSITAIAAEYNDGLAALPAPDGPRLLLFLGSNIGNFTHEEAVGFLARIRERMELPDRLLVGVDLLKSRRLLEAAYNDAEGVTAQFNKNLLARINQELGASFDLDAFDHAAPFIEARARIEMRLVSRRPQTVPIAALQRSYLFEEGEAIHTENSHKYSLHSFAALCHLAGLEVQTRWLDEREWFAVLLLKSRAL
ncbi:MAG TPA: L-histidine N(alpha)-methyltransferase [Chthonomonadaceae bacterium]|nr:L-histidine N(alpha)-methyltransferase [Chthonomonadaceae bacterium]